MSKLWFLTTSSTWLNRMSRSLLLIGYHLLNKQSATLLLVEKHLSLLEARAFTLLPCNVDYRLFQPQISGVNNRYGTSLRPEILQIYKQNYAYRHQPMQIVREIIRDA